MVVYFVLCLDEFVTMPLIYRVIREINEQDIIYYYKDHRFE